MTNHTNTITAIVSDYIDAADFADIVYRVLYDVEWGETDFSNSVDREKAAEMVSEDVVSIVRKRYAFLHNLDFENDTLEHIKVIPAHGDDITTQLEIREHAIKRGIIDRI